MCPLIAQLLAAKWEPAKIKTRAKGSSNFPQLQLQANKWMYQKHGYIMSGGTAVQKLVGCRMSHRQRHRGEDNDQVSCRGLVWSGFVIVMQRRRGVPRNQLISQPKWSASCITFYIHCCLPPNASFPMPTQSLANR